ncbi:glutathione peroxidase [Aestuariirhabdus litorea]|uniref:Glutathione peroxidase n=1 Tax=Aestuariirhabdus litorea TaxID=2528527 RepID=A0A3P3VN28_9GAMM|nr:glutathione peroxidase [Aestuariirhabdus litorea]RRJ83318.1 glutathione peroxidase [Aestuariirhabdus litorea]RWW93478.1 glutathione peroxidase [Endozoicomonadaceae bacterium GTF-13]
MRTITLILGLMLVPLAHAQCPAWLDHSLRKLHSRDYVNLCQLAADKPLLIVNTASRCGFTPQFKGLEALHKEYVGKGLVVIGFASNDFRQEAKDEEKAATVCYVNYGVTFTMIAPGPVRGSQSNPVFRELARQSQPPEWNFNKYLVDREGVVIRHFGSRTRPDDPRLRREVERLLF